MNTAIKQLSPLTRPIGPGKLMRNFAINEQADQMLPKIARLCGEPNVSAFLRDAAAYFAEAKIGVRALPFKSAIQRTVLLFFITAIPCIPNFEARRPRVIARSVAHAVRRQEVVA